MTATRRSFLKASAALAATAPLAGLGFAAASPAPAEAPLHREPTSNGLLFDRADLPRLRANFEHPRFASIRATLLGLNHAEEQRFLRQDVRLNNHVVDMLRVRQLLEQSSFVFVLTENPEALATARLALKRICDYPRWDYFLEAGKETLGLQRAPEAIIAVCCALDWLGDKLTKEERETAEAQVASKGAPACFRTLYGLKYPDRVHGWSIDPDENYPFYYDLRRWPMILNGTNLKIVPTAALGIAAACLQGKHPEAEKWLRMARQSAQAFAAMYNPDGSYDEGSGYWSYATLHLILLAEVLERKLGLRDQPFINYPGTIRFALALAMPCGGPPQYDRREKTPAAGTPRLIYDPASDGVNFSDAGGIDVTPAAWVGRAANDPISNYAAHRVGTFASFHALIWYRPEAPEQAPGPELLDLRLDNEWVVSRTGWAPEDGVVAFRSGGPANHEHADRNSVIFKAHGERLFHDPFGAAYAPTQPRWLLRQTEAHTAILIAGKGHQYHRGEEGTNSSWAAAKLTDFRTGPGWMSATSDATEAYALVYPDALLVTRTIVFLKPDVLILLDRVRLKTPAPVQLRFQVFNSDGKGEANAEGPQFTIRRPLAVLQAQCAGLAPLSSRVGLLALPEPDDGFPFVEVQSASSTEHVIVTASAASPSAVSPGVLRVAREEQRWLVTGVHAERRIEVSLELTTDVPVVTVAG